MKRHRRGYSPRPTVPITDHAMDRIRQYWPSTLHLYSSEVRFLLSDQILDALEKEDYIVAPGGVYVPIVVLGGEGYAVLVDRQIKTVLPVSMAPEIHQVYLKKARTKHGT